MKLTLFLSVLLMLNVRASVYSQNVRVSLDHDEILLENILDEIKKQSEFTFLYRSDLLKDIVVKDVSFKRDKIDNILEKILLDQGYDYEIIDKTIVIRKALINVYEQQIVIKGKISDSDGNPLPGVNIVEVGTTIGAVTDLDGNYSISVSSPTATLSFSYIGYLTEEIEINNRTNIDVVLVEDIQSLDEVVVIGYGEMKKSDLTGSVTSVRAEDLEKVQVTTIEQTLQGQAPGVQVIKSSGSPGGGTSIRIRGGNSVLGGNEPLYVIDGYPIYNSTTSGQSSLSNLNPGDIESIEILKDASATAIYGTRGANGVVIITTKKGKAGKSQINFRTTYGLQQVSKKLDLLNAAQFAEIANEAAENDGIEKEFDLGNLPNVDTDWQDEIFRDALQREYALTFSGGTDVTRYAVTGSYYNQDGIVKGSDFERASVRVNLDQDVKDWIKITNNYTFSRTLRNVISGGEDGEGDVRDIPVTAAISAPPTIAPYTDEGEYSDIRPYNFSPGSAEHPLALIDEILNKTTRNNILGLTAVELTIIEGLKLKVSGGLDYRATRADGFRTSKLSSGVSSGSIANYESLNLLNENTLSYSKVINSDNRISAVAGFTYQQNDYTALYASGSDFPNENMENRDIESASVPGIPSSGGSKWQLLSWLGRINYSAMDRYLFTVTGRADGSSRFGEGNKWAFFPSVALGWRLSEEEFIKNLDIFSNLKLRTSWGLSGNQEIGLYQSIERYGSYSAVLGGTSQLAIGFGPNNIANPDLKWETTSQINLGLDFGFIKERLRLTVDYYSKHTTDLLARVELPQSSGFTTVTKNIGELKNNGFELGVGADILNGDFSWTVNANFSTNKNEVVKTAGGVPVFGGAIHHLLGSMNIVREGDPVSAFFGFVETGEIDESGNIVFKDLDGNGTIDNDDRTIIGNPHPDFIYGITNNFSWKNFDFSFFIQGVQGNDIYNVQELMVNNSFNKGANMTTAVLDRWSPSNPNPNAAYPKMSASTNFRISDRAVEDGSYVRLKNVVLGYNLPAQSLGINFIQSLRIFVTGQDLITISDYSWYDPEVNIWGGSDLRFGIDRNAYPHAKTFLIGLNVGF